MAKKVLTIEQYKAIELMASPDTCHLTQKEVAEQVGVNDRTIRRWKQDEVFLDELEKQTKRKIVAEMPKVTRSLLDKAINEGSGKHIELLLRTMNWLSADTQVQVNNNVTEQRSRTNQSKLLDVIDMKLTLGEPLSDRDTEFLNGSFPEEYVDVVESLKRKIKQTNLN